MYALTQVVKAREFIYQFGSTVDGAKVDDTLGEGSWVPIVVSVTGSMLLMIDQVVAESVHRETRVARS